MQSRPAKGFSIVERGANAFPSSNFAGRPNNTVKEPIALSSSSASSSSESSSSEDTQETQVAVYQNNGNTSNQLVLYDPSANGSSAIEPILPEPIKCQPSPRPRFLSSKVLPSVGAFTVQCANCFKWRLIPTKEKYEEIREHILKNPFVCETASEWRPEISCNDPTDISQDGSRLWAIDKPNIAQPPSGWQRLLRIRGEGSTKFADIYYQAPTGKKLRSMVEVQKFLMEHPEYTREGVRLSQFSFQIPKPLQEDYVRKRPPRLTAPINNTKPLEPSEVNPLAWAAPGDAELQLGRPALPSSCSEIPASDHPHRPAKQAKRMPQKQAYTTEVRLERGHPRNND